METLKSFTKRAAGFERLAKSQQIDIFGYYLQKILRKKGFLAKDILACFDSLDLPPYSNISQYLSNKTKARTRSRLYFKKGRLFFISPQLVKEVEDLVSVVPVSSPSHDLVEFSLVKDTRTYISEILRQAIICYDNGCYDACSVMLRRLIETLIIELYERRGIDEKVKEHGDFIGLKRLIDAIVAESSINLSRNSKLSLPKFKFNGDLSAHSRRYIAKKSDIDSLRADLRVVLQELVSIIDYPNWK